MPFGGGPPVAIWLPGPGACTERLGPRLCVSARRPLESSKGQNSKEFGHIFFDLKCVLLIKTPQMRQISTTSDMNHLSLFTASLEGYDMTLEKTPESKQFDSESSSKILSKDDLRQLCVLSSRKLPGIFSKVVATFSEEKNMIF